MKILVLVVCLAATSVVARDNDWLDIWYHEDEPLLSNDHFERLRDCPEHIRNRLACYTYWKYIVTEDAKLDPDNIPSDAVRAKLEASDKLGPAYLLFRNRYTRNEQGQTQRLNANEKPNLVFYKNRARNGETQLGEQLSRNNKISQGDRSKIVLYKGRDKGESKVLGQPSISGGGRSNVVMYRGHQSAVAGKSGRQQGTKSETKPAMNRGKRGVDLQNKTKTNNKSGGTSKFLHSLRKLMRPKHKHSKNEQSHV